MTMTFVPIFLVISCILLRPVISETSKEYSSYRRYPLCKPYDFIRHPHSIQDVVDIVNEANQKGVKVKAFGVRHSQTDIICTEGIPVDMTGLVSKKMNADNTATIGAGLNLRETTQFLRLNGRALKFTPAFGNITIGGAIGTGAHGSSIKHHASISSQVVSVKIVNGKGQIQEINNPEDLKAFKMHLGLLGIVVEVTLKTVELYKMQAFNYAISDNILTSGAALNMAKNADQLTLYWFPEFKEVVVANWTVVDKVTSGNDYTNDHVPSMYSNFAPIASLAKEIAFSLTESKCSAANTLGYSMLHIFEYFMEMALLAPVPDWVPIYATPEGKFKNPSVGYYDEMIAPICHDEPQGALGKACVWSHGTNSITILDNEFGLELNRLGDFVEEVKAIVKKTPTAFPLIGICLRFSEATDIYMSTAYGRQTVHFEFYLWNRDDMYDRPSGSLAGYQTILQTLTKKFNGRSHWGKSGMVYHSSEMLDMKLDETARQNFIRVMNKYDPTEVFINNFGRRIKRTGTAIDADPSTKRCAILDNCFCSKDSDCGANQLCSTVSGYDYKVCKTRNEAIPTGSDVRSMLTKPGDIVPWFASTAPTLIKSTIIKCSIGDAVETLSLLRPSLLRAEKLGLVTT